MNVAKFLDDVFGGALPVKVEAYDGTTAGSPDSKVTVIVRTPDALRRFLHAPGELGLARAYVAGDLDLEGSIFDLVSAQDVLTHLRPKPRQLVAAARLLGADAVRRLPLPPEEVRLRGRMHSRERDAAAVSHHYDVSNRFYELILGPAMTYSCAVFESEADSLETAQARKLELVCRKLDLKEGMRLLDVGCGWGSMAIHAARVHGVRVVGVTVSQRQVEWARAAVARAGLQDLVDIRCQDYRDINDGPYDAISSIGMFEHVGTKRTAEYLSVLHGLLRPGGRLLNHAISSTFEDNGELRSRSFLNRYVFPDGELMEAGQVVTAAQRAGFEARNLESLREHYNLTLRRWVDNLEANWEEAVAEVGEGRTRVWHLYLAGSADNFGRGGISVNQLLAVRPAERGASGMPLRPAWEPPNGEQGRVADWLAAPAAGTALTVDRDSIHTD
ncbi:MAG: cyclopropane-fatty-acyl-phospholipid synthase, partial [Acidimicrobiia bacterium]|nr:cyclopropane-fatty-acyl-phospholipid synthase [Acidimicrobiia bacterium]